MRSITIETMDIKHFMKYKELHIDFSPTKNVFKSFNGKGKTTILHAISWCLTGHDFFDRTQFEINFINPDGSIEVAENTVELKLKISVEDVEKEVTINRTRKNGTAKIRVNGIQMAQKDYGNWFITNFGFGVEDVKLMVNPNYAPSLDPKSLEKIVMENVSTINEKDVAKEFKEFAIIQEDLETQSSILLLKNYTEQGNEFKNKKIPLLKGKIEQQASFVETLANDKVNLAQLKIKQDRLKEQMKQYDNLMKQNNELQSNIDKAIAKKDELVGKYAVVEEKMDTLKEKKQFVEMKLLNYNANEAQSQKINEITQDINKLELVIENQAEKLEEAKNEFDGIKVEIENEKNRVISFETTCPTCGQELPKDKIKEISDKEYAKQKENVANLAEKALQIKDKFLSLKAEFTANKERLESLKEELEAEKNAPQAELLDDPNYNKLVQAKNEIDENLGKLFTMFAKKEENLKAMDDAIAKMPQPQELDSIINIQEELTEVTKSIQDYDKLDEQTAVLENLRTELVNLEKVYATFLSKIEAINKLRVVVNNRVSESLAVYFKIVEFITSEITKDGVEKPTFKLAYQGREFSTISTGEKMLVSLDLLNGIQLLKDISMPILIDSLTELSELPNLYTQIIACQTMQKISENHPQYEQYNAVYSEVYQEKGL